MPNSGILFNVLLRYCERNKVDWFQFKCPDILSLLHKIYLAVRFLLAGYYRVSISATIK